MRSLSAVAVATLLFVLAAIAEPAIAQAPSPRARTQAVAAPKPVARKVLAPRPIVDIGPGSIVSAGRAADIADSLRAMVGDATAFVYRSTGVHGERTLVSGAYYLPSGPVPAGGWPVIAFAHGTTGVLEQCAPSHDVGMFGNLGIVEALLGRRLAVVATDYQGLGTPGPHPYLNADVAAANVLDSIRALHRLTGAVRPDSVLFGISQGGQAVEAAAENAHGYAPELPLLGTAMISPSLNRRPITAAIEHGALSRSNYAVVPLLVEAVRASVAPWLNSADVLHGGIAAAEPQLLRCSGATLPNEVASAVAAAPGEVYFANPAVREAFDHMFSGNALPRLRYAMPAFIIRGTADTLVESAWSDAATADMCRLGIDLSQQLRPGDHVSALDVPAALAWITGVLKAMPTASNCPR